MKRFLVAIDGPAGAGKSTVAKRIAQQLGITYVDTGAMYRAIAWLIVQEHVHPKDESSVCQLAQKAEIQLTEDGVYCNGNLLTDELRTTEISHVASTIAAIGSLRTILVRKQQEIANQQSVVMDGRDIGTHVLPDADVKIYLTASVDVRAERRYQELQARGQPVDRDELKRDIEQRDLNDKQRAHSPLQQAEDAILIDTTDFTIDEVVTQILQLCRTKMGGGE